MEDGASPTIMVVDDSPMNVEFMRKHLGSMGYQVSVAYRGVDAIKQAQETPPDLVLLDVIMPDLTGFEVCRLLKMHPETSDIPVIFVTAKGEVFDRIEGLELGAYDFISKPFHLEELKARVRGAIRIKASTDKLKKQALDLSQQSIIDELTGLYNKRYLMQRLMEEGARAARYHYSLACVLVDPDNFRDINEQMGAKAGDKLLASLAHSIKSIVRAIDISARYGPEEFLIVLPQTSLEGAQACGEKIRRHVEEHAFETENGERRLTVSCGVAECEPHDLEEADDLLRRANLALLQAKHQGRNTVVAYQA
ncbi:MAG: diguanylate cyclase [Candidatus Xenobia bacterium]